MHDLRVRLRQPKPGQMTRRSSTRLLSLQPDNMLESHGRTLMPMSVRPHSDLQHCQDSVLHPAGPRRAPLDLDRGAGPDHLRARSWALAAAPSCRRRVTNSSSPSSPGELSAATTASSRRTTWN